MTLVIDASVAFKWLVPEQGSAAAIALLGGAHFAPTLLLSEIGNAFWKKAVREQINPAVSFDTEVESLPDLVEIRSEVPYVPRALSIARLLDHAIYDCVYLAMAEQSGDRLVTADSRFAKKAATGGFGGLIELLA